MVEFLRPRLGRELSEVDSRFAVLHRLVERLADVLGEMRLVLLDRQHVLAPLANDPGGDLLLAAHGVEGHHGSIEIQQLQQFRNRGDLVGFGVRRHLAERHVILHRPGADHVQGGAADAASRRTTSGLPIDGHGLQRRRPKGNRDQAVTIHQHRHPVLKTFLELLGIKQAEDAAEGVMRGDAPRQSQEGLQPVALGFARVGDLQPTVGAAEDGAHRHEDDLLQEMPSSLFATWIGEACKVLDEPRRITHGARDVGVERHGRHPRAKRSVPAPNDHTKASQWELEHTPANVEAENSPSSLA